MTAVLASNLLYLAAGRRRPPVSFRGQLSILIPARNEERNLERLLPPLLAQVGVDFEVIVYDDDSDDETGEWSNGWGTTGSVSCVGVVLPPDGSERSTLSTRPPGKRAGRRFSSSMRTPFSGTRMRLPASPAASSA